MSEEKTKKVNGLRTAVRYGALTAAEAKAKLEVLAAESGYKSPELVKWLERRS